MTPSFGLKNVQYQKIYFYEVSFDNVQSTLKSQNPNWEKAL